MAILLYISIAYVSVFIHEFGHYIVAYLFGVRATEVVTGMGLKVFSVQTRHTRFIFNIFPGGGVTIYNSNDEIKLSTFHQIIVLLSGVTLNYLTAALCASLYIRQNFLNGIHYLNHLMVNFIQNIFTLLSLQDLIFPNHTFNESINMIADDYSTQNFILFIFIFINLLLFLFNLIPIPFFDGGQILSLLIDPIFYKIGISTSSLEIFKDYINRAVGFFLILLIILPLIGQLYQKIMNSNNPPAELFKWILIILGAMLILRIFKTLTRLIKSDH